MDMERLSYEEMVEGFASHELEEISFSYPGYSHYRNCSIRWIYDEFGEMGRAPRAIEVRLSSSERCLFYGPINGSLVIFRMKGHGNLTLIDVWPKVEILEIKRKGS